jgi:hypothetical protein
MVATGTADTLLQGRRVFNLVIGSSCAAMAMTTLARRGCIAELVRYVGKFALQFAMGLAGVIGTGLESTTDLGHMNKLGLSQV